MSRDKPSLTEVLDAAGVDVQQRIRTIVPATVVVYDPVLAVATVKVARKTVLASGIQIDGDTIVNRPVLWPRGGGMSTSWDLLQGDPVLLLVADRQADEFVAAGAPIARGTRMHSITDCFVLPAVSFTIDPIAKPPAFLQIGRDDGTAYIRMTQPPAPAATVIESDVIQLGATAVEPVALVTSLIAALDAAVVAAIAAGTGAPGTTGTLAFTAFQTAWNAAKTNAIATKTLAE